jgi:NitT/TauT family transport system substrate-binding protein
MKKPSLVLLAFCLQGLLGIGQTAQAEEPLKKVRIVVGTTVLNISYPWLNLPRALGYWKQEGYDVEVTPLAPPAQPITLLVAGQTDFAQVNATVLVQARATNNAPVKVAMLNGITDWSVAVAADSPYTSIKDLKGKMIGTFGLASGGVFLLRAYLQDNGIDPDKDVKLIAVGGGAPAADALRTGRVQALMFWASAMAGFENTGLKLRYLRGDDWRKIPDFTLAVMEKTVNSDPKMVEAIVRGAAKAELFALTNPDCVRRIQWKMWPSTKPTGAPDDATLSRWELNLLQAQLNTMKDAFELNGGKYYGNFDPSTYDVLQNFMVKTNQITHTIAPAGYAVDIPDFYRKANDFDAEAVKQAAIKCENW